MNQQAKKFFVVSTDRVKDVFAGELEKRDVDPTAINWLVGLSEMEIVEATMVGPSLVVIMDHLGPGFDGGERVAAIIFASNRDAVIVQVSNSGDPSPFAHGFIDLNAFNEPGILFHERLAKVFKAELISSDREAMKVAVPDVFDRPMERIYPE